jgi:hypothetical protein
MTRNLKTLGLALAAVLAISAMAAQGASAAVEHEFHADGEKAIVTGTNSIMETAGEKTETVLNVHKIAVGAAGTWQCNKVQTESTQVGTKVGDGTYKADTITVIPHYSECTFGGNPVTVNFNHCALVFDSDTTAGNSTGGEHANVEIECSGESVIEIDTSICTITIGPQLIKHAVRYENDKHNKNAVNFIFTAHKLKMGKKKTTESQTGCLLFPTGEIGTYTGKITGTCYKDEDETTPVGTEKTTPVTKDGAETECTVSPGA